jgi:hypothetical protein
MQPAEGAVATAHPGPFLADLTQSTACVLHVLSLRTHPSMADSALVYGHMVLAAPTRWRWIGRH